MDDPVALLQACVGFEWDDGNSDQNWVKHQLSRSECEELFFNEPLLAPLDEKHSTVEPRLYVLGQTDDRRRLFVVVTLRGQLVRVISARPMSKREEKEYDRAQAEEDEPEDPEIPE